jgi:hypothetical protein
MPYTQCTPRRIDGIKMIVSESNDGFDFRDATQFHDLELHQDYTLQKAYDHITNYFQNKEYKTYDNQI